MDLLDFYVDDSYFGNSNIDLVVYHFFYLWGLIVLSLFVEIISLCEGEAILQ